MYTRPVKLETVVFDTVYPQDVVYVYTNKQLQSILRKNSYYRGRFPQWSKIQEWRYFGVAWLRLMSPTEKLRGALNDLLSTVVQAMHDEYRVWEVLNGSDCCNHNNVSSTVMTLPKNSSETAEDCENYLKTNLTDQIEFSRINHFAGNFCSNALPILKPNITTDQIHRLKGHDKVDLNLVCVHLRIGHSATFSFEKKARNELSTLPAVWDFLRPYIDKGFHVYLATDAEQVRTEGKKMFGDRVHFTNDEIIHVATAIEGQDKKDAAMRHALMEQLLLATSCKVLVVSRSGFSMRPAAVRHELGNTGNLFMFERGGVRPKSLKYL